MTIPLPKLALLLAAAAAYAACGLDAARAAEDEQTPCTEDAMLVFDASGSMSGNGWGYGSENPTAISRIDKVRSAPTKILPSVTRLRRVGLISYGPGPYNQCNVQLEFPPVERAANHIIAAVSKLVPAGRTPLAASVEQEAETLDFREKPGVIVVLTDAEETCSELPCILGRKLHEDAVQLTIHVIGLRVAGYTWTGEQSIFDVKCLVKENGGLYITVEAEDELIKALERTLGCPMITQRD